MAQRIAVVLAAGKGTRMESDRAKVLHDFAGRALVSYPLDAARTAGVDRIVVVTGYQEHAVQAAVRSLAPAELVSFAHQTEQNGTGHAVLTALPQLPTSDALVWVLNGDTPLVRPSTLEALADAAEASDAGIVMTTIRPGDKTGYGRLIRDEKGDPAYIREERDCSPAEFAADECNAGLYCVRSEHLHRDLPTLGSNNAQGEIYLTDLVAVRARSGTVAVVELDPVEAAGINTPAQLRELETLNATREAGR